MKYALLLFLVVFFGCSRTEIITNIDLGNSANAKLALFCLLTPADSIYAQIRQLRSVGDKKTRDQAITNAIVTLENTTTGKKIILRNAGNNLYNCAQKDFPVLAGNRYTITALVSGFPSVQSACVVPTAAAIIENIFYGPPFKDVLSQRRRVELRWQDVSSVSKTFNYFVVETYEYRQFNGQITQQTNVQLDENISTVEKNLFLNFETTESKTPHTFYLFTTENTVFEFYKMARKTEDTVRGVGTGDFFGAYQGIIPESTNIEGGYGIFGAYLRTQKTIEFQ